MAAGALQGRRKLKLRAKHEARCKMPLSVEAGHVRRASDSARWEAEACRAFARVVVGVAVW